MIELSQRELEKYIGLCLAMPSDLGLAIIAKSCKCKGTGNSADGPFEVSLCGRHQYLEAHIPWERESSEWRDRFLGAVGSAKEMVVVEFSGCSVTATYNDKQGESTSLTYSDFRKHNPETCGDLFSQRL
jgi:hypothetical protein